MSKSKNRDILNRLIEDAKTRVDASKHDKNKINAANLSLISAQKYLDLIKLHIECRLNIQEDYIESLSRTLKQLESIDPETSMDDSLAKVEVYEGKNEDCTNMLNGRNLSRMLQELKTSVSFIIVNLGHGDLLD